MNIYTILDSKAEFHMTPFFARTDAEAIRTFVQAVNDQDNKQNLMAQSPADFTLFYIGEFDEKSGLISASFATVDDEPLRKSLGNGKDFQAI